MDRKRILMISAQFVPEIFGGGVQQCLKLSRELIENSYQVTVLTSRSTFKLPRKEDIERIHVIRIWSGTPPQLMGKNIISSFIWFIGCVIWFAWHKQEFDIIHIHQVKFQAFVGALISRWYKKPALAKIGNPFDLEGLREKSIFGRLLYKTVKKDISIFVAISTQIEKNLCNHNLQTGKVIRISNGVHQPLTFQEIQQKKQEYRLRLFRENPEPQFISSKYFLSVGRLSKGKNIFLMISAFMAVASKNSFAKLFILGDGILRKEIEAFILKKGMSNHVICMGYVKNVRDYMIAADFFVLPSSIEGMSNSLLEAMSVGLVAISNNISGSADLINNNKNGFLVDTPLEMNLPGIMLYASQLPDKKILEMQYESFSTISENYTMEIITKKYINLYHSIFTVS